jgi:hypothetical protein
MAALYSHATQRGCFLSGLREQPEAQLTSINGSEAAAYQPMFCRCFI